MRYEWDKAKAAANLARHGVAFDSVKDFAWDRAEVAADSRKDYKEPRWIAASIETECMCLYTPGEDMPSG
jgi:hypothetical protein